MNGYASHSMDSDPFDEKGGNFGALRTFDAFPKTKATYTRRSSGGGYATLFLALCSIMLCISEFSTWWKGEELQQFSVEKGISHQLQINLDAVIRMPCKDLHVNVQDASGDRILAGEMLKRDDTSWDMWTDERLLRLITAARNREIVVPGKTDKRDKQRAEEARRRLEEEQEDTHAEHVLGEVRRGKRKFHVTPKLWRGLKEDSCRIYGSLEGNKVQGDFHITARGHGYQEFGEHLAHDTFNFSHIINELSFGPLYPAILNPLDNTYAQADDHFHRFQYYLSIVPTIYTTSREPPRRFRMGDSGSHDFDLSNSAVRTNQYAVTGQSGVVPENTVPGIFFKFDIEPILLTIVAARGSLLALLVRVVNVVSGVLVGGGWIYQLWGWGRDVGGWRLKRRANGAAGGMLHGHASDGGDD